MQLEKEWKQVDLASDREQMMVAHPRGATGEFEP
jgi:hypothetical protein